MLSKQERVLQLLYISRNIKAGHFLSGMKYFYETNCLRLAGKE